MYGKGNERSRTMHAYHYRVYTKTVMGQVHMSLESYF